MSDNSEKIPYRDAALLYVSLLRETSREQMCHMESPPLLLIARNYLSHISYFMEDVIECLFMLLSCSVTSLRSSTVGLS